MCMYVAARRGCVCVVVILFTPVLVSVFATHPAHEELCQPQPRPGLPPLPCGRAI